MPRLLIILGCALIATACAKDREQGSPADSLVQTIHAGSPAEAEDLAKNNTIHCADPASCPAAVGQLTGLQGKDVSACTAFLVGDDLAVTNSHCIPSSVKLSPSLCADRIRITFPATTGFREESIACKTLEARSERPNDISPDLALIRLVRSPGRPPFRIQSEVNPGEIFTAYKVNPSRPEPDRLLGELVAEACPAVANNYLFPLYRGAKDPVFVAGCTAVPGNSGAPIVGANGAAGLLQASLKLTAAQRTGWLPHLEKTESDFAPLALGTNLRCLDARNGKIDPSCAAIQPEEIERPKLEEFLRSNELGVETDLLLQPYLRQTDVFYWAREVTERRALEQTETLRPHCVRRTSGEDPAQASALVPTFQTKIFFNRYLQPRARVELLSAAAQSFRYSRFDLLRTGETKIQGSSGKSWAVSACE